MTAMDAKDDHIAAVFGAVKSAAMLIEAINPNAILESWERQETTLPFTDPTVFQSILAARDDMRRKKEIIEAAARFLAEWNRIKAEALADAGKAVSP